MTLFTFEYICCCIIQSWSRCCELWPIFVDLSTLINSPQLWVATHTLFIFFNKEFVCMLILLGLKFDARSESLQCFSWLALWRKHAITWIWLLIGLYWSVCRSYSFRWWDSTMGWYWSTLWSKWIRYVGTICLICLYMLL